MSDLPSTDDPTLAPFTTLRVGGPADRLVQANTVADLIAITTEADAAETPLLVLGGGSNVLIADSGVAGTTVLVRTRGIERVDADHRDDVGLLTGQAGDSWDDLVAGAVADGLAGVECLAGIPGSVGATPIQNVGAYGQEVADTISRVEVFDRRTAAVEQWPVERCEFGYRDSVFKRHPDRYIVVSVTFRLQRSALSGPLRYPELARTLGVAVGDRAPLSDVREAVLTLRRAKGMVLDPADHDTWSAGSFFTNPIVSGAQAAGLPESAPRFAVPGGVKLSAAWLIEAAGFGKGYGLPGPAALSSKHTLALSNRGGATTAELVALARRIRDGVRQRFGITLVPEPVMVNCAIDEPGTTSDQDDASKAAIRATPSARSSSPSA